MALFCGITVSAADNVASGYCGANTDGTNVRWTLDSDGTLTLSGEGFMTFYFTGKTPWADYTVTSVVIEEGILNVSQNGFDRRKDIVSVTIPDSVTDFPDYDIPGIPGGAFSGCSNLTNLTLGSGIKTIRMNAFLSCGLTELVIPSGVETIEKGAFAGNGYLKKVTISDTVTSMVPSDFTSFVMTEIIVDPANTVYASLDGVVFSKDMTTLLYYPCAKADTAYSIPDTVTTIASGAFNGAPNLTQLHIPASVTTVEPIGQGFLHSLTQVTVDAANPVCMAEDGVLFNKDKTALILFPAEKPVTAYTVPATATKIDPYAFSWCMKLTSITLPEGLKTIEEYAFAGCQGLTTLPIPSTVETIGGCAFFDCNQLTSITLPEGLQTIGAIAFSGCNQLTEIAIPEGITTISELVFYNCSALTAVHIPASVTSIGWSAFDGTALTDVYYAGSAEDWLALSKESYGNDPLLNATVHTNYVPTLTLTGSVTTSDTFTAPATLRLLNTDGAEVAATSTSDSTYTLTAPAGTYTLEVSKFNHVPRTYTVVLEGDTTLDVEIHLIGDVNGDGKVTIADYGKILNHCKRIVLLDGYALTCADVNNDGRVTIADYGKVLNHCKRIASLWEEEPEGDSGDSGGGDGDSGDGDGDGEVELPMIPA